MFVERVNESLGVSTLALQLWVLGPDPTIYIGFLLNYIYLRPEVYSL